MDAQSNQPRRANRRRPPEPPLLATADGIVGRVRVWTEAEWVALTEHQRPTRCEFRPGLGWVGLVPEPTLNN